jgi:HrpA-like RNA helicase
MSSRKQRLDVGLSSSSSSSSSAATAGSSSSSDPNKTKKRRFQESPETDLFSNSNNSKSSSNMSQTNSTINRFTMQPYSKQYQDLFKKRRQLPVWDYKEAFMTTLDRNQVN